MEFDLSCDFDDYISSKSENTASEVIILDDDSCDDLWNFLDLMKRNHPSIPVYILASRFDVKLIEKLNIETNVQGIILKSQNNKGLFEFLKKLNN
jgi:hypothetical protein